MDKVRNRLWLWGHEAGSQGPEWGIEKRSRMTPAEAAFYMGIPNLIMVRYEGKPEMPFDQLAISFRPLAQVYWSVIGAGGTTSEAETQHVLDLAGRFPNITGVFMDDFFLGANPGNSLGVLSLEEIATLKRRLAVGGRRLDLAVTLYTHQLDLPLEPYLELCDQVSLWTWKAPDLRDLEQNFAKLERLAPRSGKLLGLYMWDYGLLRPMPLDSMTMQCEMGLRWLREGRVGGLIFLASCICDLELETVEWGRAWIAGVGDESVLAPCL
jgi:hypothetical protein